VDELAGALATQFIHSSLDASDPGLAFRQVIDFKDVKPVFPRLQGF